jgi:hypothetical protein
MPTFQVKTESLAVRCDICHQADQFNPATGICTRCSGIEAPLYYDTITQPVRQLVPQRFHRFRYTGTNSLTGVESFRNIFLGCVLGTLPGMVLPGILVAIENHSTLKPGSGQVDGFETGGLIFAACLCFSFIPGCISGFLIGKKLRGHNQYRSISEYREYASRTSLRSTFFLFLFAFLILGFYQMVQIHLSPQEAFFGAFCSLLLPATYFPLFNPWGGLLTANLLKFLERNNIEDLRE